RPIPTPLDSPPDQGRGPTNVARWGLFHLWALSCYKSLVRPVMRVSPSCSSRPRHGAILLSANGAWEAAMDDKRKDRVAEFQRSKEQLARFNQEMEKVTPKPTLRQWIRMPWWRWP